MVKISHMTLCNQSECIITTLCNFAMLNIVCDIRSGQLVMEGDLLIRNIPRFSSLNHIGMLGNYVLLKVACWCPKIVQELLENI